MNIFRTFIISFLCLGTTIAFAQQGPVQVGEEFEVNIETNHPYTIASDSGYVFRKEFHSEGSSYVKLHFTDFQLAEGDYVVITSPKTDQQHVYAGDGKWIDGGRRTISEFWSLSILSDHAVVKLYSTGAPSEYGFRINKVAYGYSESYIQENILESVCGNNQREEIACYSGTAMFEKGKAVCKILQGGSTLCTGWLLGTEGHVMTNNHCVSSQNGANNLEFQFNFQYSNCSASGNANSNIDQVAQTSTFVCTDQGLDYTLLKLPVNPTNTYGFLSLRSGGPSIGERIYIPQHPSGIPKKIAVEDDQTSGFAEVTNIDNGGRVEYYADTENGSSGSPVIGYSDHLVVALHNTGGCPNGSNKSDAIINDMGNCLPNGAVDNPGNLVTASFSMDEQKSCDGMVNFTDQSFNVASRTWYFGDGDSTSVENPTHTYTQADTYTVQLIVSDTAGNKDTATRDVEIALVPSPTVDGDTVCGSGTMTLSASSNGGPLRWYDTMTGGSPIGTGSSLTTPNLSNTTSYYVEALENTPVQYVGPADNNIAGGRFFYANDNWGSVFSVQNAMILKSVKVFADSAGQRTIELQQGGGNVLQSKTVNIPSGMSRVTLNFQISKGDDYLLKLTGNNLGLFRNNGGANYPYQISGLVSITGNNTTSGTAGDYYYYFYDWEVREVPCESDRKEVKAVVQSGPSTSANITDAGCQGTASGAIDLSITNTQAATDYQWSNGATTQDLSNLQSGAYIVTVDAGNGCVSVDTFEVASSGQLPNVSANVKDVSCEGDADGNISVSVTNVSGSVSYNWSTGDTTQNIQGLSAGVYNVTVNKNDPCETSKSVVVDSGSARPNIQPNVNDVSCNGLTDGRIALNVTDTVNPVSYQWAHGENGEQLNDLSPGIYVVTVQNGNNCAKSDTISIQEPSPLDAKPGTKPSLIGNCTGRAWTDVSGGTPSYSYQWNDDNQQTNDTAKGLCPGTYAVTITDQNGCSTTRKVTVDTMRETGLNAPVANNIELYPVPVDKQLVIHLPEHIDAHTLRVRVHNVLGENVLQKEWDEPQTTYTLNMRNIERGAYLVGIRLDDKWTWQKVSVGY